MLGVVEWEGVWTAAVLGDGRCVGEGRVEG